MSVWDQSGDTTRRPNSSPPFRKTQMNAKKIQRIKPCQRPRALVSIGLDPEGACAPVGTFRLVRNVEDDLHCERGLRNRRRRQSKSTFISVRLLLLNGGVVLAADVGEVDRGQGEDELELLHRVRHDLRDNEITKPLVV